MKHLITKIALLALCLTVGCGDGGQRAGEDDLQYIKRLRTERKAYEAENRRIERYIESQ